MNHAFKTLITAFCGLLLASSGAAGSLEELEGLAKTSPEQYGRAFDNTAKAAGTTDNPAINQEQLRQLMLADLDSIKNIFEARYAPAGWKGELNGWSLDAEIQKARNAVNASPGISVTEYRKLVRRVFASAQDYHVFVNFHSTEWAELPINITESGGRYYLSYINRNVLPEAAFPFKTGDEVTAFDGKDIDTAIADYMAQAGMNNVPGADRAKAAAMLHVRAGSIANDMPPGPVAISIRPAGAAEAVLVRLDWDRVPEMIPPQNFVLKSGGPKLAFDWMSEMYADLLPYAGTQAAGYGMGDKVGYLPDLGEKVWEAPNSGFRAYIYRNPVNGRHTGYVRIPTYKVTDGEAMVRDFARIISEFDRRADSLVIDQLNNGGGTVVYMYALASMLTDTPLEIPKHRITLTPADIADAHKDLANYKSVKTDADAIAKLGENISGYPVSLAFVNDYRDFDRAVIKQWESGKKLSDPLPVMGIPRIQPAYGPRFTKPIMILTNELDASCGDFFPAIMQDNRKAVIFGARTGGAGGVVKRYKYQNSLLGMNEFGLTETIALRPNGQPIESLGVTPDIPYAVQPGDLQAGFKAYAAAVNAAVSGLAR